MNVTCVDGVRVNCMYVADMVAAIRERGGERLVGRVLDLWSPVFIEHLLEVSMGYREFQQIVFVDRGGFPQVLLDSYRDASERARNAHETNGTEPSDHLSISALDRHLMAEIAALGWGGLRPWTM